MTINANHRVKPRRWQTSGALLKSDEQLAAKHLEFKCEYFCPSVDSKSGMDAASRYCSCFGFFFFFFLFVSVCLF